MEVSVQCFSRTGAPVGTYASPGTPAGRQFTLPLNPTMRFRVRVAMQSLRAVVAPALLLLGATISLRAQAPLRDHIDPSRLRPGSDSFVVILQGKPRGWQRLAIARAGDGWQFRDAITIDSTVSQESVSTLDADLSERSLRQEGLLMGKPMRISLDWSSGRVRGTSMTPVAGAAGTLTFDTITVAGVVDDNAVTPLLAVVRWRDSLEVAFPVFSSGRGTITNHRIKVIGSEQTTVPAGQFDTWRIEMRAERSVMIANVTKSAPYRIVRMRNGPAFDVQLLK